jgi:hypothetical protein
MKVAFIQFEVNDSKDVKLFAEIVASIGVSVPSLAAPAVHANMTEEQQRASMTCVTNQLAKAIGTPKPKLDTKQRARVAAKARWEKKRADDEKKLEKATEEKEYLEVSDPIQFDPNAQPTGEPLVEDEPIDGRHIIEGNWR